MIRMLQERHSLSCATLLLALHCADAKSTEFKWNSDTHQILHADFSHDGIPDLLLQGKSAADKHYLVIGQTSAPARYDLTKRIELPQKINQQLWHKEKFQLLAIAKQGQQGSSLLAIAQNGSSAMVFNRLDHQLTLSDPVKIFEPKKHKWLRDSVFLRYFSGDFDGDGNTDLLQLDSNKGAHQIILADKNQSFENVKKLAKTVKWGLQDNERLIVRDFNKDGKDDVLALSRDGKKPHVLLQSNGKGGFDQEDGKSMASTQASFSWAPNIAGIAAVTRKSDKQVVLFRAYNQSERHQLPERCIGWVYDTETDIAKEYCPAQQTGQGAAALVSPSDTEQLDCPIELSVDDDKTLRGDCDTGFVLPNTPATAPTVSYGPHQTGASIAVVLANTWDSRAFTYQLSAFDAQGNQHPLGDIGAPHGYYGASTVSMNVQIATAGTYNLMYRACNLDGCSGFGPAQQIAIQAPVVQHLITTDVGTGGDMSPTSPKIAHGSTVSFRLTADVGYDILPVSSNCGGLTALNPYVTAPVIAPCSVSASFRRKSYTVTSEAGSGGSISPTPSLSVQHGDKASFKVTADLGYDIAKVEGCGVQSSSGAYITGAITQNCNVKATFTRKSFDVTSTTDGGGTISPTPIKNVLYGDVATFSVTAHAGKEVDNIKGCNGKRTDNAYTTGPITASCEVSATFKDQLIRVTSTAGANGSITPEHRDVIYGKTTTFTVTPKIGYIPAAKGCDGVLTGTTYTTGVITGACNVAATFTANSYTVTATASANGTISPPNRTVNHGDKTTFTVTPNPGFTATAKGCDGVLTGTTYTTGVITGACNVEATFTANSYTVTATAGANGSISPPNRTVNHGDKTTFTVTPNPGFTATAKGCDGVLTGTTYTTGVITGACNVEASFAANNTAQTIYLHTDALGSVILETDASGQVKKRTEYKPFGESKDN